MAGFCMCIWSSPDERWAPNVNAWRMQPLAFSRQWAKAVIADYYDNPDDVENCCRRLQLPPEAVDIILFEHFEALGRLYGRRKSAKLGGLIPKSAGD